MTAIRTQPGNLEPLLIPTLRLLIAMPLIMAVVALTLQWLQPTAFQWTTWTPDHVQSVPTAFLLFEGLALLALFIPGLPQRLDKWFLPLIILLTTVGLLGGMIGPLAELRNALAQSPANVLDIPYAYSFWPPAFFALIPLVVVAWQYDFRYVVFYALALVAVELLVIAVLFQGMLQSAFISELQIALFRTVIFLSTGYLVSQLVTSQRLQRAELVRANAQLAAYAFTQEKLAVSQERNRLARDLHDTLAHYLSGLILELEGARLLWDADEAQARQNLDDSIGVARSGLVETRRALQALRAAPLDDLGLIGAVRELAQAGADRNGWQLELDLPDKLLSLPPATEGALYRIAQETLTNIERHAQARTVHVHLVDDREKVRLEVVDDGVGYRPETVAQTERFGLSGMAERTALIGGALQIASAPGSGTSISASIPHVHVRTALAKEPHP